ncbi:MAG TPA: DUF2279 domain-containing protein [Candidatus Kapabacteria bacterium]|nr:DUF2279 domain-containing protein [Candidatus Kapabacteria bacterium]
MIAYSSLCRTRFILILLALFASTLSRAQSRDTVHSGSFESFGFRAGLDQRPIAQNKAAKPVFDGYYEVPVGPAWMSYDVMVSFRNFATVDLPFSDNHPDYVLDSYGFHGNLRWILNSEKSIHPFGGFGIGFDAYQDTGKGRVSASVPIMAGAIFDLNNNLGLEIAARATPLLYFGQQLGISYGITAGLRFSPYVGSSLNPYQTASSSMPDTGTRVDWGRVGISAGALVGGIAALHIYQLNAWWANQRTDFHVIEDADYQHDFDKGGHTFGAYYSSFFFDQAYRWAGLDTTQSVLFGALSGALWEFYVEIEDGFARDWGFSRGDAKADVAGASLYLLTQRVPLLKNFKYKWSYFPSYHLLKNEPDIPGQTENFIEDYTGQSYWMSLDVHSMLQDLGVNSIWPKWLNVAVGLSGAGLGPIDTTQGGIHPYSNRHLTWLVSLDYDFSKIIPESSSGFLNFLRRSLDYWHFPAPAWEFSPEHKFFVLFPLQMTF